jgi:hypothetical protein
MEANHEVRLIEHDQPRMGLLLEQLHAFTGARPPTPRAVL